MKNDFSKSIDLNLKALSEAAISEKIEEFFDTVDSFVKKAEQYEVKTTADRIGLEKWADMTKQFAISVWNCWNSGSITISEALQVLQDRTCWGNWKKQFLDYKQREVQNDLDKYKGWANEDGHEFTANDLLVSRRPDPAQKVNREIVSKELRKSGIDIKMLISYYKGEKTKLTKNQVKQLIRKIRNSGAINHLIEW